MFSSIAVTFGSTYTGGNLCVQAVNGACVSATSCLTITPLTSVPPTPGAITGPVTVAPNTTKTYTIVPVANATGYVWTAPANATLVSVQGTTSATFDFGAGYTTGLIAVNATNCKGNSPTLSLTVNVIVGTKIQLSQCGTTLLDLNAAIIANSVTGATNYRFKVVNGATTQTIETVSRWFYLKSLTGGAVNNTTYTISVASKYNGFWSDYGDGCSVTTPTSKTKIQTSQCGATLSDLNAAIVANSVTGATHYRFKVVNGATTRYAETVSRWFYLKSLTGGAAFTTTYTISVAIKCNGVWGDYGDACTVTTPTSKTKVQATQCGATLADLDTAIFANSVTGATHYRFKVVNGASTQTIETVGRSFNLTALTGGGLYYTAYTISVATKYNGAWGDYGDACTVTTPGPKTKVQASQCGTTLAALSTAIVANSITGATNYRFKVVNGTTTRYAETVSRWFYFKSLTGGAVNNTTYTISVAVKYNGDWRDYGDECTVTTPSAPLTKPVDLTTVTEPSTFTVTGYPNPYTNTFQLDITTQSSATIAVKVYDMMGKLIEVRNSGLAELGTMEIGDRYATGVYNVIVTQGTEVKTVRMIKK
jgi:hypothetical protein